MLTIGLSSPESFIALQIEFQPLHIATEPLISTSDSLSVYAQLI